MILANVSLEGYPLLIKNFNLASYQWSYYKIAFSFLLIAY